MAVINHYPIKKFFRAALRCLGAMYETLGRLVGRSYEESFHQMARWLKNAEVKFVVSGFIAETA